MEEYKKQVIGDILLSINTYEKVIKFEKYRDILGDCKIYLFDEEYSNLGSSFGNYQLGICGIYGAGDYTKTWVIDSFHDLKKSYLQIGKTLDLDLNIFTYLNNIMQGRNMKLNRTEIVDYLNYIKLKGFQCGITSALMERATKYMPLNILSDMLISFVKFDKISYVDESKLDIYLNEDDYAWAKQMHDMALALSQEELKQYDIICCCVMKAYLIKKCDSSLGVNEKIDKFIYFCLHDLNCYLEKEIVLLALYLSDDERTKKTFEKLEKISKIEENILNVSWDIYHIRLIEQIMLYDNMKEKEKTILSYFATADKGLIDAMNINPLKAFVIIDNYPISYHSLNIDDVCRNNCILEEIDTMESIRRIKIKTIDFRRIKQQLQLEIHGYQDEMRRL